MRVVIEYFLFAMLSVASFHDCLFRKIPNSFVIWSLFNGMFLNFFTGDYQSFIRAGISFLAAFPFYLIGAAGAGDVKIFVAVGMFFCPQEIAKIGLYTLCCTAVYGLAVKIISGKTGVTRVPMVPGMMLSVIIMCMGGNK